MSNNLKNLNHKASNLAFLLLLVGLGLGFVSFIVFSSESIGVFAQANVNDQLNKTHSEPYNNTLYVSGTATDKVSTDLVTISIGVQSTNKSATDALNSNSKIANEIISSLTANDVKENEISTSQYTIQPNYNYSESGNIINTTGFTVANILTIQSSNFNNISLWIDSAVSAGANTINGVDFRVSDQSLEGIRNTLIEQAIVNAKQKAGIAASAVDANIVGIKSIAVITDGFNPMPFNEQIMQKAFTSDAPSMPPIIPGEQEVSVTVQITYLLD
ncbi:MAG TPA: SIMPL domain-containing protein [Candidatus Nitrosocosmicus sp.]|nr:SIMPL domain-containing protein [Candidatus Nitrosocosmicus sp.]